MVLFCDVIFRLLHYLAKRVVELLIWAPRLLWVVLRAALVAAVSDDEEAPAPPPMEGVEMPAAPANIPEARPARVEVEEERFYDVIPRGVCIILFLPV